MPVSLLWYDLAPNTRKTNNTTTNNYIKYCVFFDKNAFCAQVCDLATWVGYLGREILKPKTI